MNTKEKIVEALEGKTHIQTLSKRYIRAETELIEELSKLDS